MKIKDAMLAIGDSTSPIPTIIFIGGALLIGAGVVALLSKHADTPERVEKTKQMTEESDSEDDSDMTQKEKEREARANDPEHVKEIRKGAVKFVKIGVALTAISSLLRRVAINVAYDKFQDVKRIGRKLVRDRIAANERLKQALYSLERAANDLKKNPETFDQAVGMQNAYCQIFAAMNPNLWRDDK